ncbi:MAG: hypothetical protein Ct9H90mP13_08850 [Pseudomonadota bacterium]|nr:MAG: hypothetical protein Ct9H90mP13_08850 [Pseudomonadota bacterium]
MDYEKLTFVEAFEELAKMLGMEVPKSSEDIKITKKQTNLKSLLNEVSDYFQSNLKSSKNAIEYLKEGGLMERLRKSSVSVIQRILGMTSQKNMGQRKNTLI